MFYDDKCNEEFNYRTFLMIEFAGEKMPMPIKIQESQNEKILSHKLSVDVEDDDFGREFLIFKFRTGIFCTTKDVHFIWWHTINIVRDGCLLDNVELKVLANHIKQYKVCRYDQKGSYISACRKYWAEKYSVCYENDEEKAFRNLSSYNYVEEK